MLGRPRVFWSGVSAITVGVLLHVPDWWAMRWMGAARVGPAVSSVAMGDDHHDGPVVMAAATDELYDSGVVTTDLLEPYERLRADGFHREADRRDYLAAHVLVRLVSARLFGVGPCRLRLVQKCDTCGGPHGRPGLDGFPDISLSMAHTAGMVVAAAGRTPVGVDIERTGRGPVEPELYPRVLGDTERILVSTAPDPHRVFLRQWVRKEALIKIGALTLDELGDVDLGHLPVADGARPLGLSEPWPALYVLDWTDGPRQTVGAAVSCAPPRLIAWSAV